MAVGEIFFFTIGKTIDAPQSYYRGFPIKKKYKQTSAVPYQGFLKQPTPENQNTPDYVLISDQRYWYPFISKTPRESDYIPYATNDELTQIPETYNRNGSYLYLPDAVGKFMTDGVHGGISKPPDNYYPPKSLVYGNNVFIATSDTFPWSKADLGPPEKNPYVGDSVRKWKALGDTNAAYTPYWYHPTEKRFYPLNNKDILKVLSSGGNTGFYLTGQKWEKFTGEARDLTLANFTKAQIESLEMQGFSKTEAESVVTENDQNVENGKRPKVKTIKNPTSMDSNSSGPPDEGTNSAATVSIVKKAIIGAYGEASSITANPQMVQIYRGEDGNYKTSPDRFIFTYRPNNISYSNIGSEWTEIDRVNNTPFVDFRNFKLMKISFEFIVGDANNLFTSCDDQIALLRKMAMRPEPVIFLGFDQMFNEQLTYPTQTGGSGVEFAIVDMSVNSVQRTRITGSGGSDQNLSPNGNINRATVSMTLQELPINKQQLYKLPKLAPDAIIPNIPTITKDKCKSPISGAGFQKQFGVSKKDYCKAVTK